MKTTLSTVRNNKGQYIVTNFSSFEEACSYAKQEGGKVGEAYHTNGDIYVEQISEPMSVTPEDFEGCFDAFDPEEDLATLKDRISDCTSIDDITKLVGNYTYLNNLFEALDEDQFLSYDSLTLEYIDTHCYHPTSYEDKDGHRHELCVFDCQDDEDDDETGKDRIETKIYQTNIEVWYGGQSVVISLDGIDVISDSAFDDLEKDYADGYIKESDIDEYVKSDIEMCEEKLGFDDSAEGFEDLKETLEFAYDSRYKELD